MSQDNVQTITSALPHRPANICEKGLLKKARQRLYYTDATYVTMLTFYQSNQTFVIGESSQVGDAYQYSVIDALNRMPEGYEVQGVYTNEFPLDEAADAIIAQGTVKDVIVDFNPDIHNPEEFTQYVATLNKLKNAGIAVRLLTSDIFTAEG